MSELPYEPVVGLEVHIQLKTQSKLFCRCSTQAAYDLDTPANTHICPVCTGQPGALPQPINRQAVVLATRLALALGAELQDRSLIDRKNYFYPDLPKGYQISQFFKPIASGGALDIWVHGQRKRIEMDHLHIEEDAGKTERLQREGKAIELLDMNRCGVPLVELVTQPVMHSGAEAAAFLTEMRRLLRYLAISNADMEKGNLRCDVNVSVRPHGTDQMNTRMEIKNRNSIEDVRFVVDAMAEQQWAMHQRGEVVEQATWGYDPTRAQPFYKLRTKEDGSGYRYFREPDQRSLHLDEPLRAEAAAGLVELPAQRRQRYLAEYHLEDTHDLEALLDDRTMADYLDAMTRHLPAANAPDAYNLLRNDIQQFVKTSGAGDYSTIRLRPAHAVELIRRRLAGEINYNILRQALKQIFESATPIEAIFAQLPKQEAGATLTPYIERAIAEDKSNAVATYRSGKEKAIEKLVGDIMRAGKGEGKVFDAADVRQQLKEFITKLA
jgi:aspartyl-tRNA(Asn)/glutamyl-tRNA(Gln) amidotransferase subunit B